MCHFLSLMSLLLPQEKEDKKQMTSACAACVSAASPQEGALPLDAAAPAVIDRKMIDPK